MSWIKKEKVKGVNPLLFSLDYLKYKIRPYRSNLIFNKFTLGDTRVDVSLSLR